MFTEIMATAGALAGPLLGFAGQQQTNSSNETMAKDATSANMAEAQRNRDFQDQQANVQRSFIDNMSSSAHQREVADLKKAGLNPILSANGGAQSGTPSAPSGSTGSATTIPMQNPLSGVGNLATSALEALTLYGGLKKQSAETGLIQAQTGKTNIDADVAKKGIPMSDILNRGYRILTPILDKVEGAVKSIPDMKMPTLGTPSRPHSGLKEAHRRSLEQYANDKKQFNSRKFQSHY